MIVGVAENMSSFKCNLKLWLGNMKRGKFAAFPIVEKFQKQRETSHDDVKSFIVPHLTELMAEFDRRISEELPSVKKCGKSDLCCLSLSGRMTRVCRHHVKTNQLIN